MDPTHGSDTILFAVCMYVWHTHSPYNASYHQVQDVLCGVHRAVQDPGMQVVRYKEIAGIC